MARYEHGTKRIPEPKDYDFYDYMIKICASTSTQLCPFCKTFYEDDAEWTHIDMGHYVQVNPNYCLNDACGAYELGNWSMNSATQVYLHGWVRDRKPDDKYPDPPHYVNQETVVPLTSECRREEDEF